MTDAAVPTSEPPTDEVPLPLVELDLALTPLRRVVRWAAADTDRVDGVRYLESNSARWLARALSLDLPDPIRELIDALGTYLDGYDSAERDDRHDRLAGLHRSMRRIDSLLGLPLAHRAPQRSRRKPPPRETVKAKPGSSAPAQRDERRAPPAPIKYWDGSLDTPLVDLHPMAVADALSQRGIETTLDLLLTPPTGEERIAPIWGAGREHEAARSAMAGRVMCRWTSLQPDGSRQSKVRLTGAALSDVHFEGSVSLDMLGIGAKITCVGEWDPDDGVLRGAEVVPPPSNNEVRLQQYGIEGVADVDVRAILAALLPHVATIRDPLPGPVAARAGQIGLRDALVQLHTGVSTEKARLRLGFDEALHAHIGLAWDRYQRTRGRGISVGVSHGLAGRLEARTSFHLTDEQQIALEDVKRDLLGSTPMCRVLTGEVGVGKGAVVLQAAVMVAENKGQVMLLTPDSGSAAQRFVFAAPLLREAGLVGRLVEGELSKSMRDALSRGQVHILFGSLDLLEQEVEFRRLALVVAEERGNWGHALQAIDRLCSAPASGQPSVTSAPASGQPSVTSAPASGQPSVTSASVLYSPRPHVLLVTATPVGAAVSMTAYGAADWTVLASGTRKRVAVTVHPASERKEAYARAAKAVSAGRQVIVAFPLINGKDALDLRDAMSVVRALESEHFADAKVGLFHGAMSRDDRRRAYSDFEQRRMAVLVATTSIEDAPALPNVSVMIVEQADRVDLGRLQRIGGFICGSNHDPEAILIVGETDESFEQRIGYVKRASDGFAVNDAIIADHLLGNIAPGSAPMPTLAFLDPSADREVLWRARHLAHEILSANPGLRNGWGADVARLVRDRWRHLWPNATEEWVCPIPEGSGVPGRKRRRRRRRKR